MLAPYQFSWTNTSDAQRAHVFSVSRDNPAWRVASKAWFESEHSRPVDDALFYHTDFVRPEWSKAQSLELVKRIGRHLFYRQRYPS